MTSTDAARLRLGTAPDSWGVWHPDHPRQTPWHRFLDEVAEAGYEWIELHLESLDPQVFGQVKEEDLSFAEAVQRGAFVEPPAGIADQQQIAEALRALDVDLFAIVEQDLCAPHTFHQGRGHRRRHGVRR